jgi:hypothetical protein
MHLAHAAAHEFTLLCGQQHASSLQRGFADDDAIVEGRRLIELRQVGAHHPPRRAEEFAERTRVDQPGDALARIAINDMGATPAVVSLRLDQAVETMLGETS